MADNLGMAAQLASNVVRFGWYWSINRLMTHEASRYGPPPAYTAKRPIPTYAELMTDVQALLLKDAVAVRDGIRTPIASPAEGWAEHLSRLREMFADLPDTVQRRRTNETGGAAALPETEDLPDYIKQDFHYQHGGHLSQNSARLYDVQVETLFLGTAGAMRRAALTPLVTFMKGRDQRKVQLLDVACGTGRFLREIRLTYPAMRVGGVDLSLAYLEEARRHLANLRPITLTSGNAEHLPYGDASQDVVTSCYLYHELPPDVRRRVTSEISRVLKPGGLFIFVDSLQFGDRPGWDGLVEAFPHRFHEPYYEHYADDNLAGIFRAAKLNVHDTFPAFLSKIVVCYKLE